MLNLVEIENVHKTYVSGVWKKKRTEALRGVNLTVRKGEILGLLGPNGAGKTTLLSVMSTLLKPDSGRVSLFGETVTSFARDIRSRINMSSGHANFPWSLTVREVLNFYAMLYGLSGPARRAKVESLIELLRLGVHRDKRFDELSTGTKQRLALGKALVNEPELLFLDEPTVGLDPDVARDLRAFVLEMHEKRGLTVVLTTHNMPEAEELCRRVAFIRQGKIILEGDIQELKTRLSQHDLEGVFLELVSKGTVN